MYFTKKMGLKKCEVKRQNKVFSLQLAMVLTHTYYAP